VVLEVAANAPKLVAGLQADLSQLIRRPDPREQQQLRRADRPGAQHYFALGANHLFAPRAATQPHAEDTVAVEL
jgi:hypothetical protein